MLNISPVHLSLYSQENGFLRCVSQTLSADMLLGQYILHDTAVLFLLLTFLGAIPIVL